MGDPARNDFFASKYFITAILFFAWVAQHLLVVKEHDHHLGRSVARRRRQNVSRTRTPFPSNAHSRWGYSFHNHFSCTKLPFASRLFSSPTQKSTHTHQSTEAYTMESFGPKLLQRERNLQNPPRATKKKNKQFVNISYYISLHLCFSLLSCVLFPPFCETKKNGWTVAPHAHTRTAYFHFSCSTGRSLAGRLFFYYRHGHTHTPARVFFRLLRVFPYSHPTFHPTAPFRRVFNFQLFSPNQHTHTHTRREHSS